MEKQFYFNFIYKKRILTFSKLGYVFYVENFYFRVLENFNFLCLNLFLRLRLIKRISNISMPVSIRSKIRKDEMGKVSVGFSG